MWRLFEHADWANRRTLEEVQSLSGSPDPHVLEIFSHVVASEKVWLARLRGEPDAAMPLHPRYSLKQCASLIDETGNGYCRYIAPLKDADLQKIVTYRNTRGIECNMQAKDILAHVALHSAHHRGQITAAARKAGSVPIHTDYIAFAREETRIG